MADKYLVQPDIEFINELRATGGESLKSCFQCATCSVACPIAPDRKPFPRKEMIAASWGLKDKLLSNPDIWLCHNCGDCTAQCPRGAKPGDVLAAIRMKAIKEYARPKFVADAINKGKHLPLLLILPAVIFIVIGLLTGFLDFTPERVHGEIVQAEFFSQWLVDIVFVPLSIWVVVIFAMGLKRFMDDIHKNAVAEGKTDKQTIDTKGFLAALVRVIPAILKHSRFSECSENNDRATPHMMVLFSFIALFIVTAVFFITLYVFGIHGPYSQLHPVKILANVGGIVLIIGAALLMKQRMDKTDEVSTYKDWYLLWLVLGLGVTGMLTELLRLADAAFLTYLIYFIHLMLAFHLVAFLPFSKLAHLVYRTVAMAYNEYSGRESSNA
ncbi:MAG: quinone-interacting membrane-bound oxidoreductase complex subunit QmoC [Desulfobacteraceae bacterium]|nr:quinone-interacting membrane-bound oxidoreductase complex subunit QmoC [Desulfobacteraceae bacterium]